MGEECQSPCAGLQELSDGDGGGAGVSLAWGYEIQPASICWLSLELSAGKSGFCLWLHYERDALVGAMGWENTSST